MKMVNIAIGIGIAIVISSILARAEPSSIPDGLYLQDETAKSPLRIKIKAADGAEHEFAVRHLTNIVVKAVHVYSLEPSERAFQIQVNVACSESDWTQKPIVLVVQDKPYFELSKSGSVQVGGGITLPASLSLKVSSKVEAEHIRERLTRGNRQERK